MFQDERINSAIRHFKEVYESNKDSESALGDMLSRGYSLFETVIAVSENLGITREEADKKILESEAWRDIKEKTMKFRDEAMQVMTEDAEVVVEDEKGNIVAQHNLEKYREKKKD